uniref:Uncharacterized protein n=1 Tax=Arundo donax TaxID=35708 RepID=A0A0A9APM4_ARUDO
MIRMKKPCQVWITAALLYSMSYRRESSIVASSNRYLTPFSWMPCRMALC